MDFLVLPGNQAPETSVEASEESKTVRIKNQSHISHILRCEGHRPNRVLATGPGDYSARLQGDPAMYASLIVHEETRVVAGQIVATWPGPGKCSERLEHPAVHRRSGTTLPDLTPGDISFFFLSSRG